MKTRSLSFALLAFVAQTFLEPLPSAWAGNSKDAGNVAKQVVQTKLVDPLQTKEDSRSRYSRAAMPPSARRIRILDKTPQVDAKGRSFYAFAIDESRGLVSSNAEVAEANWHKDSITGCVYFASGEVMVKRGDAYIAGSALLGVRSATVRTVPVG